MRRWALLNGDTVANVVEQDSEPTVGGTWVDVTGQHVGPGMVRDGDGWKTPDLVGGRIITKVAMLTRRLKTSEFVGILTAAKTDPAIEAWKYVFDAASQVDLDSQNTKDGMSLLVAKGLLTQARADAILNDPVQPDEQA